MKKEFERIYDQLYDFYNEEAFFIKFLEQKNYMMRKAFSEYREVQIRSELFSKRIRDNVTTFEFDKRFPLRTDAKFYLLSTFDQMVVKPILWHYFTDDHEISYFENKVEEELIKIINHDIPLILKNAYETKKEDKISGHEIMIYVDRLWGQLECSKMEIWG